MTGVVTTAADGLTSVRRRFAGAWDAGAALLLAGRMTQLVNGLLLSALLVRRFGLEVVGSFALGIAAVNVIANVCPAGLIAYLPRLRQPHGRSAFIGLAVLLGQLPVVLVLLAVYAGAEAQDANERALILLVGMSGYLIAVANTGLMLSIMAKRFWPGFVGPLCETLGLLAAAWGCSTPQGLAGALLGARAVTALLIWGGFRLQPVSLSTVWRSARQGASFLGLDILSVLPEQTAPLFLSAFVSRADLGLFRLCQQLLVAADSPGWSFVQAKYPGIVEGGPAFLRKVTREVHSLSVAASVACGLGSIVVAALVLRTPAVVPFMLVLSSCLVWRYKSYLYRQAFCAAGRIRELAALSAVRLLAALGLFYVAMRSGGLWGAVVGIVVLSVASGGALEWAYRRWPGAEAVTS